MIHYAVLQLKLCPKLHDVLKLDMVNEGGAGIKAGEDIKIWMVRKISAELKDRMGIEVIGSVL